MHFRSHWTQRVPIVREALWNWRAWPLYRDICNLEGYTPVSRWWFSARAVLAYPVNLLDRIADRLHTLSGE